MSAFWRYLIRFVVLVVVQVFILNNIYLHHLIVPVIYLVFVIKMPFKTPKELVLLTAFLLGIVIDLLTGTPGVNAAATTAVAFLRPTFIKIVLPKMTKESSLSPTIHDMGFLNFLFYTLLLVFTHSFLLVLIETFDFQDFGQTLLRVFLSTPVAFLLVLLYEMLLQTNQKSQN